MNKNNLIRTDTIWYKISNFFRKIFIKDKPNIKDDINKEEQISNFVSDISVIEEIKEHNRKKSIAQKLINKEISVYDLEDEELEEMTEYFKKDIEELDKEINRVKEHILQMKKINNQ